MEYTRIHGLMLNIFDLGVMITGAAGIGKSEAALELLHRGHQLVSDDAVEVFCKDGAVYATSPEITRHFMEIRGVGIIDAAAIFGKSAVLKQKKIGFVVDLEPWVEGKKYERLGLKEEYTEILGVPVPKAVIPVAPGRNLAIVIEVAARNLILKSHGYNAAKEAQKRMSAGQSADNADAT